MIISNPWTEYITRSYAAIKNHIILKLQQNTPEIQDFSPSNILMIFVDIYSGIAEMIGYYIDRSAEEALVLYAKKFSSMRSHASLVGYSIKTQLPSIVELEVTSRDSDGNLSATTSSIEILEGQKVVSSTGLIFTVVEKAILPAGYNSTKVYAKQMDYVNHVLLGQYSGVSMTLPVDMVWGQLTVEEDVLGVLTTYEQKDSLILSTPLDKHYTVDVNEDRVPRLVFGDGVNGFNPSIGNSIYISYYKTKGLSGRVGAGEILTDPFLPGGTSPVGTDHLVVTNNLQSVGGTPIQTVEQIRNSLPLTSRTLSRAVTAQDMVDLIKLSPHVDKAKLINICGNNVKVYITPVGGGIPNAAMIATVQEYIEPKKLISVKADIYPAGETYLGMGIVVTGRPGVISSLLSKTVTDTLLYKYGYQFSDINKATRLSDIYAAIDNLPIVDYLDITNFYQIPFPRPYGTTTSNLQWDAKVLEGHTAVYGIIYWQIYYTSLGNFFTVIKEGVTQAQTIVPGAGHTYGANFLNISILSSAGLSDGDSWEFYTYPCNEDLVLTDFTLPIFRASDLNLTINTQ